MNMVGNVQFLAFLYFLQGLPYGLQSRFLPLYFRTHGMSLANIGFFKLLLTPWMLKALWAPFVDHYGSKKQWLAWSMLGLCATCVLGALTSPDVVLNLAIVLLLFNILTSTQDIAVDGLAIQILATSELASGNVAQVVGYKLGAVFSGGLLIWLVEVFHLTWSTLFIGIGFVYILAYFSVMKILPSSKDQNSAENSSENQNKNQHNQCDNKKDKKDSVDSVNECESKSRHWLIHHFKMVLSSLETRWTLLYVLVYKLVADKAFFIWVGEQGSLTMLPMFLVDHGISTASVGLWCGIVGQGVSIVGSYLGGLLVSHCRYTPYQTVLCFSKLRLVPLLLYVVLIVTWTLNADTAYQNTLFVALVSCMSLMLLGSGIVTTTTFTLMMYCSQRSHPTIQASHYTTMATVEVLGKLTFSILIGSITDIVGYPLVFSLFVLLGMLVLPVLWKCPNVLKEMNRTENKIS